MEKENLEKKLRKKKIAFGRSRKALLKKARELATDFDNVDVALMVFDDTGDLTQFSSKDMQQILARYRKVSETQEGLIPAVEIKQEHGFVNSVGMEDEEASSFKPILNLMRRFLGSKDLTNVNSQEHRTREIHEFNEAFLAIIENKQQILIQRREKFRIQLPKVVKETISELVVQQLSLLSKAFTSSMSLHGIFKLQAGLNKGLLSMWNEKELEQFSTQEPKVVDGLKKEISNIVSSLLDDDITCIVFTQELGTLVRGLHGGLLCIWQRILTQHEGMNNEQLELSRVKEHQTMLHTEALRGKADVLRGSSSGSATNVVDTNLYLGYRRSSGTNLKRKMPDGDTPASDKRF